MKKILFVLIISATMFASNVFGQFTIYTTYDNKKSAVYEVEDLTPAEMKIYNNVIESGASNVAVMLMINAMRAYYNLTEAPATIIDYHLAEDLLSEDKQARNIVIELINTTTKTIKEITFEFEFKKSRRHVYDNKTGDKSCKLVFNSPLEGRPEPENLLDVYKNMINCYHILPLEKASYKKLFHNKKANTLLLKKCLIKYTDGSTSNKAAIFDRSFSEDETLLNDGPLKPFVESNKKINN